MSQTRFTEEHEWIRLDGEIAVVGITKHAADQLGDVVSVELPEVGDSFKKGDEFGAVDSAKAASEVYAPAGGEVVEVNSSLEDSPETINDSPEDKGWFIKLKLSDPSELDGLMDAEAYKAHTGDD
jgi:glycine cleavage system H protein